MTPQETARMRAEVMIAFAEGKTIQSMRFANNVIEWIDIQEPVWDWIRFDYRIKPAEPKQVTLEAWIDSQGEMRLFTTCSVYIEQKLVANWTRVRALDLEYEATEYEVNE